MALPSRAFPGDHISRQTAKERVENYLFDSVFFVEAAH
jgi:hypothetical protein